VAKAADRAAAVNCEVLSAVSGAAAERGLTDVRWLSRGQRSGLCRVKTSKVMVYIEERYLPIDCLLA